MSRQRNNPEGVWITLPKGGEWITLKGVAVASLLTKWFPHVGLEVLPIRIHRLTRQKERNLHRANLVPETRSTRRSKIQLQKQASTRRGLCVHPEGVEAPLLRIAMTRKRNQHAQGNLSILENSVPMIGGLAQGGFKHHGETEMTSQTIQGKMHGPHSSYQLLKHRKRQNRPVRKSNEVDCQSCLAIVPGRRETPAAMRGHLHQSRSQREEPFLKEQIQNLFELHPSVPRASHEWHPGGVRWA